jgi:quercetin dioxygenase-like cupin family protein
MHRTISVNYNFVIQGQLELILDSGETRTLGPGDMVVQRAINHAWRNPSQTSWARIAAMALPAEEFMVGGRTLESTGLPSMPASQ